MGKAMLAMFSEEELEAYLGRVELIADTPNTITDRAVLKEEIRNVRMAGFATDDEENDLDVICIGAALVVDNKLYGAFSVSTPKYRFDREKTIAKVLETKKNLLAELGKTKTFG